MTNDDSPLEDDEEEILIYVEFEGTNGSKTFCNEKLELNMIGLDSEHPIMQVNGKYYEGTYEDAVGTYMFFEKDNQPVMADEVFDRSSTLKYCAKTRKILKMKRVFVKPRLEVLGDSNHPHAIPNMDIIKKAGVPAQYQEKALSFWEDMRKERLDALNEYLKKQRQREEKRQQGIELDSESDDDNQFAMYKQTVQKSDEATLQTDKDNDKSVEKIAKNDENMSTIIDPGPSTSKGSAAWYKPLIDSVESFQKLVSPIEPKNQGYIEVVTKKRFRKIKQKSRKNKNKTVADIETSECSNSKELRDSTSNDINEMNNDWIIDTDEEICNVSDDNENFKNDEISMDQVNNDIENINLDDVQLIDDQSLQYCEEVDVKSDIYDKKVEKQRKREAKMNEISQRLKKIAAGINQNHET